MYIKNGQHESLSSRREDSGNDTEPGRRRDSRDVRKRDHRRIGVAGTEDLWNGVAEALSIQRRWADQPGRKTAIQQDRKAAVRRYWGKAIVCGTAVQWWAMSSRPCESCGLPTGSAYRVCMRTRDCRLDRIRKMAADGEQGKAWRAIKRQHKKAEREAALLWRPGWRAAGPGPPCLAPSAEREYRDASKEAGDDSVRPSVWPM